MIHKHLLRVTALTLALSLSPLASAQDTRRQAPRTADYILAVVNQELVTAAELQQRLERVKENAQRSGARLPPDDALRDELLEALITERVLITHAREAGGRVDDAELERAMANVAAQNQMRPAELRERLAAEGIDYARFRNNLRDQILMERVREREVNARINITEPEINNFLDKQRAASGTSSEFNIAQIRISVPDGAGEDVVAERQAVAQAALARAQAGEDFAQLARELSDDATKENGGALGMRPASRLPDVFVAQVRNLKANEVAPGLLRTGAGFHVLKLVERRDLGGIAITQTRARHILLRPSEQLSQEAALRRLQEFRAQIQSGSRSFEQLARDNSEDSSAATGGDLGWVSPGAFVPEFERAMDALPINGLSDPVISRFGAHLIQVVDRRQMALDAKQQRELARNALRGQKFETAYEEWLTELRNRAYVELREPPQ